MRAEPMKGSALLLADELWWSPINIVVKDMSFNEPASIAVEVEDFPVFGTANLRVIRYLTFHSMAR